MENLNNSCCPVCSSPGEIVYEAVEDYFFQTKGVWSYLTCDSCLIFWLGNCPSESEMLGYYSNYYTSTVKVESFKKKTGDVFKVILRKLECFLLNCKLNQFVASILKWNTKLKLTYMGTFLKSPGKLLDIGSGNGDFLIESKCRGWAVCGVEPSEASRDFSADRSGVKIYSDLSEVEHNDFDVVTMNNVIEHVHYPAETLEQINRVLSDKGILIIRTPNLLSFGHRWFGHWWRGLESPRHINIFSEKSLSKLLSMSGFNVVEIITHRKSETFIFKQSAEAKKRSKDKGGSFFSGSYHFSGFYIKSIFKYLFKEKSGEEIFLVAKKVEG